MPESNGPSAFRGLLPGRPLARRLILGIVSHILEEDGDILTRWRARLTASILLAALLLSAFPAYNTINYLVRAGYHWQGAANLFIGAGVAWLLLSRLPSNRVRGWFLPGSVILVRGWSPWATPRTLLGMTVCSYTGDPPGHLPAGPRTPAWALAVGLLVPHRPIAASGFEWGSWVRRQADVKRTSFRLSAWWTIQLWAS